MPDTSSQAEARPPRLYTQEDKDEATAEYKAAAEALREKTTRLRALRLAKEAAEKVQPQRKSPAKKVWKAK